MCSLPAFLHLMCVYPCGDLCRGCTATLTTSVVLGRLHVWITHFSGMRMTNIFGGNDRHDIHNSLEFLSSEDFDKEEVRNGMTHTQRALRDIE